MTSFRNNNRGKTGRGKQPAMDEKIQTLTPYSLLNKSTGLAKDPVTALYPIVMNATETLINNTATKNSGDKFTWY